MIDAGSVLTYVGNIANEIETVKIIVNPKILIMRYATIISLLFVFCFSHFFFSAKEAPKKSEKPSVESDLPLKQSETEVKSLIASADTAFATSFVSQP